MSDQTTAKQHLIGFPSKLTLRKTILVFVFQICTRTIIDTGQSFKNIQLLKRVSFLANLGNKSHFTSYKGLA